MHGHARKLTMVYYWEFVPFFYANVNKRVTNDNVVWGTHCSNKIDNNTDLSSSYARHVPNTLGATGVPVEMRLIRRVRDVRIAQDSMM